MTTEPNPTPSAKRPRGKGLAVFLMVWSVLMMILVIHTSDSYAACQASDDWMCFDLTPLVLIAWAVVGVPCLVAVIRLANRPLDDQK